MRPLVTALLVALAAASATAACHDRTPSDVDTADAGPRRDGGRLHMIVDVSPEGAPKVEGTNEGQFVELRAEPTTPFGRLADGIDTAKHLGGGKFIVVVGDRRTKPFVAPPFDPSGAAQHRDVVAVDDAGAISVNGTKVASPAAAASAIGGDASARAIAVTAGRTFAVGPIVDLLVELTRLGRPIVLAVRAG